MDRYEIDSTTVIAVAALMDCKPSQGTANALNDMRRDGLFADGEKYGRIAIKYAQYQQRKIRASRKAKEYA